jgi:hypothetical protein
MRAAVILALAVATAAAVRPPRIELDLSALDASAVKCDDPNWGGSGPIVLAHPECAQKSVVCPAGLATNKDTCPLPKANVFDFKDADASDTLEEVIYKVNEKTSNLEVAKKVNYAKTGTYIIKYNARDASGNKADELTFTLVLDDTVPPVLSCDSSQTTDGVLCTCSADKASQEFCRTHCTTGVDFVIESQPGYNTPFDGTTKPRWSFCPAWLAVDAVSANVSNTIDFSVRSDTEGKEVLKTLDATQVNDVLAPSDAVAPLGKFSVEVKAHDRAGSYGKGTGCASCSGNNQVTKTFTFVFVDTIEPRLQVKGPHPNAVHECGVAYSDRGAVAKDARDGTITLDKLYDRDTYTNERKSLTSSSNVDPNVAGAYNVTYFARDSSDNWAKAQRYVLVEDKTAPEITLIGDNPVTRYVQENSLDMINEPGISVFDKCDKALANTVFVSPQNGSVTAPLVTMTWSSNAQGQNPGNVVDLTGKFSLTGKFTRTYKVWDTTSTNQLFATITREYDFVDSEIPTVTLVNPSKVVLTACDKAKDETCTDYVDAGASCADYVGGAMKQEQIIMGGDKVDRSRPGQYIVTYKCHDNNKLSNGTDAPNWSDTVNRTVVVRDSSCPSLTLAGADPIFIEANFPFVDPGASVSDELEGTIQWSSGRITTVGNTVDARSAFMHARSCQEIFDIDTDKSLNSGEYFITTYASGKFERMQVFCDFSDAVVAKTYVWNNAKGAVVVPYSTAVGNCGAYGLSMATLPLGTAAKQWKKQALADYNLNTESTTNEYFCEASSDDISAKQASHAQATKVALSRAEPGVYDISYYFTSQTGRKLTDCGRTSPTRRVTVTDTLAPVITLFTPEGNPMKSSGQTAEAAKANPAWDPKSNPFLAKADAVAPTTSSAVLMAESLTAGANAWVLGAIASAVMGVALLAMGQRRPAVATSVPI